MLIKNFPKIKPVKKSLMKKLIILNKKIKSLVILLKTKKLYFKILKLCNSKKSKAWNNWKRLKMTFKNY